MAGFKGKTNSTERNSVVTGVILTLVIHVGALCLVSFTGLKYIYPPPPERVMLIDFADEQDIELVEEQPGIQPQAEDADMENPIELAQRSESPYEGDETNLTPETREDDFGDVETPTPPSEEPKLDPRAAFPGMAKRDTSLTAAHKAEENSDNFKAGQSDGNTNQGRADGKPNAHVKGRNTVGNIPRPVYNVQESGIVVVNIWVDNYGNVVRAVPGGDGTTVLDKTLYAAARNAAMDTHFNMSADAPAMQEGTITYYFNLK